MSEVPANPFAAPEGPPPDRESAPTPPDPGSPTPPVDPVSPYGQSAGVPAYGTPPDSPAVAPPPYSAYAAPSYGPPGTLPPPHGYPNAAPQSTNGLALASMIIGIVSVLMCAFLLPALLGLVLSIVALIQTKDGRSGGRGMAIAGVATSAASLVLFAVFLIIGIVADTTDDGYSSYTQAQSGQVAVAVPDVLT